MNLKLAQRSESRMRVALCGPSGSGKTYSALELAFGLTRNNYIAIVDTESGSASLYSHLWILAFQR
jgi:type II secretory pathway predicted ATPase ExeA